MNQNIYIYVRTEKELFLFNFPYTGKTFKFIARTIGFCYSPQDYSFNMYWKIKLFKISPRNTYLMTSDIFFVARGDSLSIYR